MPLSYVCIKALEVRRKTRGDICALLQEQLGYDDSVAEDSNIDEGQLLQQEQREQQQERVGESDGRQSFIRNEVQ